MILFQQLITAFDTRTGFDRWGPDTNPLVRQIKQREGRFSLRATLWLAFGLGMAGLLFATMLTLSSTTKNFGLVEKLLILAGWGLHLLTPLIVTLSSARITHRLVRSSAYEMLWLTPLSNESLVRGHVFIVLYRLRYLLATLVVIMPLTTVETFRWFVTYEVYPYGYQFSVSVEEKWEVMGPALLVLLLLLALWGFSLLGAVIGVRTALLRSNDLVVVMVVLGQFIGVVGCPCCGFPALCAWLNPSYSYDQEYMFWVYLLILGAMILITPYTLVVFVMRNAAHKWQR